MITAFKNYLLSLSLSPISRKLYLSDIRRFLAFIGGEPTLDQLSKDKYYLTYLASLSAQSIAPSMLKRTTASLRQFTTFLSHSYGIVAPSLSPTESHTSPSAASVKQGEDYIKPFSKYLTSQHLSPLTIKSYKSDITRYLDWAQSNIASNQMSDLLTEKNVEKYLNHLSETLDALTSTIDRKSKSIARFQAWFRNFCDQESISDNIQTPQYAPKPAYHAPQATSYSLTRLPSPGKAILSVKNAISRTLEKIPVSQNFNYRSFATLAVLLVFATTLGIFGYRSFSRDTKLIAAYPSTPVTPNRNLSFQGRLEDAGGTPITAATNFEFKLWDDLTVGSQLYTTGTCSITPDADGVFSTQIGSTCGSAIASSVFSENANIFLEVKVAAETLSPRQPISSVAYALNSETIQGFPISSTISAIRNTIVPMNQWGEIIIGEQNPRMTGVSGNFQISAPALTLSTSANGDIALSPNGTGQVNINSNSTILGDLTITGDDLFMGTNTEGLLLIADGTNFNPTAMTGDVTITGGGVTSIGSDRITETMLKSVNGPTDELCLSYESTVGDFEWQSCGTTDTWTLAGDSGSSQTITGGDTANILGGTNGIDTLASATDILTLNLDTTEINNATFGAGSGFTWTFDASAGTDTSLAFGNDLITLTSASTAITGNIDIGGTFTSGTTNAFQINSSGIIASIDGVAHTIDDVTGNLTLTSNSTAISLADDVYLSSGLSTFGTAVSDGTVEATQFCTGDGETNCVTDFSTFATGINYWTRSAGNISPLTLNDTISATTSAAVAMTITQTGAFNALLVEDQASDTTPFVINQDGYIGVGTSAPALPFHVWTGNAGTDPSWVAGSDQVLIEDDVNAIIQLFSPTTGALEFSDSAARGIGWIAYTHSDNSMQFKVNNSEAIRIISTGDVGIGTTTPTAKLDVAGDASASGHLVLRGTGTNYIHTLNGSNFGISTSVGGDTGLSEKLTLLNSGNVGIGTTSPAQLLDVSSNLNATIQIKSTKNDTSWVDGDILGQLAFYGSDTSGLGVGIKASITSTSQNSTFGGSNDLRFATSHTDGNNLTRMTIDRAGNVGIGTTAPSHKLHVSGGSIAIATGGSLYLGRGDTSLMNILGITSDATTIRSVFSTAGVINFTDSTGNIKTTIDTSNGYFGILDSTPDAPLDVLGDAYISDGLSLYETAVSDGTVEATQFCTGDGETNCVTDFSALVAGAGYWSSTTGVLSPTTLNDVLAATTSATVAMTLTQTGAFNALLVEDQSSDTTPFVIDQSGNVGIGKTTANAALDVAGTASVSGTLTLGNGTTNTLRSPFGPLTFGYKSGLNTWGTAMTVQDGTGNIGIGTTSPSELLSISGSGTNLLSITRTGTSFNVPIKLTNDTNSVYFGMNSNEDFSVGTTADLLTNGQFVVQRSTGNVGIGTTTPTAKLDVAGDASVSGHLVMRGSGTNYIHTLNGSNFGISTSVGGDTGLSEKLTVLNSGNIGIGDTTPASLFTVGNGDLFQVNSSGIISNIDGVAHTIDDVGGNLTLTSNSTAISLADDVYLSSGLSTFGTAVSDGTVEATRFCTGDGETNCVTDFSSIISGSGYWTRTTGVLSPTTLNDVIAATTSATVAMTLTQTGAFNALLVQDQASDTTPFVIDQSGNMAVGGTINSIEGVAHTVEDVSGNLSLTSAGTSVVVADDLAVNGATSADITSTTNTATVFDSTVTNLTIGSAATTLNLGTGTAANAINIGTGGTAADTLTFGNIGVATTFTFNSGASTTNPLTFDFDTVTTGTATDLSVDGLTTGTGLLIDNNVASSLTTGTLFQAQSVATSLTTAADAFLGYFNWNPGSATTAVGDLFRINIGTNGTATNLFNLTDNGSSLFSVSETTMTSNLPANFTSAGDVSMAYDLNFTNPTASNITSAAPLTVVAGESFNSSNLTLKTYNSGDVVIDAAGGVTLTQAQAWDLANSSVTALNIEGGLLNLDTTNSRVGIGTAAPTQQLQVYKQQNAGTYIEVTNSIALGNTSAGAGINVTSFDSSGQLIAFPSDFATAGYQDSLVLTSNSNTSGGLMLRAGTASTGIKFAVNSATSASMTLDSGGYLGIGDTTPLQHLVVSATEDNTTLGNNTAAAARIVNSYSAGFGRRAELQFGISDTQQTSQLAVIAAEYTNWDATNIAGGALIFGTKKSTSATISERMRINQDGLVGIGTTVPDGKFQVTGAATGKALAIFNETGDQSLLTASASGITKFTVASDGTVYGTKFQELGASNYLDPNNGGTALDIAGDILKSAAATFTISSTSNNNIVLGAGTGQVRIGSTGTGTLVTENIISTNTNANIVIAPNGTGTVVIGVGGAGKLDAATIDPPYTINGAKFATYMASMTGVKEETTGNIYASQYVSGVGYRATLDLATSIEGSDIWLFSKTTSLKHNLDKMVVLLSAAGNTKTWYDIDAQSGKLYLYSLSPTTISYRLTAPRYDAQNWLNTRDINAGAGLIVNDTSDWSVSDAITSVINAGKTQVAQLFGDIETNLISPLDTSKAITITAPVAIKPTSTTEPALSVDGEILAATISARTAILNDVQAETITAKNIVADTITANHIEGLDARIASLSGKLSDQDITSITDRIKNRLDILTGNLPDASDLPTPAEATGSAILDTSTPASLESSIATGSAILSSLSADFATINGYLAVIGQATMTDLDVTNVLYTSRIDSKTGTINLAGNTLIVDSTGTVAINGDLVVSGKVLADSASLNTLELGTPADATSSSALGQLLSIYNESGVAVATIDASGSANLASLTTNMITISGSTDATSSALLTSNISSTATAGVSTLVSPDTELTISSPYVTKDTLVYLTPTTNTQNKVLFVKSKNTCDESSPVSCVPSFTIGIDSAATSDISFNWWIIQVR